MQEGVVDELGEDCGGRLDGRQGRGAYAGFSLDALHKAMAAREVEFRQDTRGGKALPIRHSGS